MPILLAIPLFTFAGYLLSETGAPSRLVRVTHALLGWMHGGLAIVALLVCALFTAFTGASGVTIVAMGALLYPALKQAGYHDKFSLGLVTTSGSLGLLFAPSLPLILYGVIVAQLGIGPMVTVDDLFLAGVLPGLLMLVLLSGYGMWQSRGAPLHAFSRAEALAALREVAWELPLPFVVLGGIYGGDFAISEAAAITVIYVLVVEVLILREVRFRALPRIMRESMVLVGGILVILGVSLASTNYLIDAEVPAQLFAAVSAHITNKLTFLLLLNVFLLISRHHARHFLGTGHHGAAAAATRAWLRHRSIASRHHLPRQYADRLFHAARGHESLHRQLPIQEADHGALPRDPAIFCASAICRADHHLLAGALSDAAGALKLRPEPGIYRHRLRNAEIDDSRSRSQRGNRTATRGTAAPSGNEGKNNCSIT